MLEQSVYPYMPIQREPRHSLARRGSPRGLPTGPKRPGRPKLERNGTRMRIVAFCMLLLASLSNAQAQQSIPEQIRSIVESGSHPYAVSASAAAWRELRHVYERNEWTPLWVTEQGATPTAVTVLEAMRTSDGDGLRPADYRVDRLAGEMRRLTVQSPSAKETALFDTAMTASVLRLVSDLHYGRIDPAAAGFGPLGEREALDAAAFVSGLAQAEDPAARLRRLDPPFPIFARLRSALARMKDLARRDAVHIAADMPVLHAAESGSQVPALRRLLEMLGDLAPGAAEAADSEIYDPALVEAVRSFQQRHGLQVDGVVGPRTLQQLRVPLSERVRQIELAMERLRWLPEPRADRFIIVNIPEFRLLVFQSGDARPRLSMEVVVGKAAPLTKTPVMQADMTAVVFRPYWNVPRSIARREILPRVERDPGYLKRNRMEIVGGRVRQRPGEGNALGLVKFLMPNRYDVYLHDTPARSLFERARRDFSHGCIRLADAAALAEFVLANRPGWDRRRIEEAMTRGKNNVRVPIEPPIPVYLFYATAIVDVDGRIHFFQDIYGHDARLKRMLAALAERRRGEKGEGAFREP